MRTSIIPLIVPAALLSLSLHCTPPPPPPPPLPPALGPDGIAFHNKSFTVVNVVDGDTIDIAPSAADPNITRIRLLGVDTPETKHPRMSVQYYGPQASHFVTQFTLNNTIIVLLDPTSDIRGKYGRLLAYIQLENGSILNELLLEQGFAYADTRFPYSRKALYLRLERDARTSGRGLWENVTFEQLPPWLQRTNPTILNPGTSE